MAIVYRHRKITNHEVFYIGIGKAIKRAYSKKSRSLYWVSVAKKYGYTVDILCSDITWEDACELEQLLIQEYGRKDLGLGNLVNMTDGGEGCINTICNEKTRQKIREKMKGNTFCLGNKLSEDTKDKIRVASKNRSVEHRKKLSLASKGNTYNLGNKHSEESRIKMSESHNGKKHTLHTKAKTSKPIRQMSLEGELIKEWYGVRGAALELGFDSSCISKCCRGEISTAYKYKWEYK
jgi:hypothetical protein